MPTFITLDQLEESEVAQATQISEDFFGANLLATYNQAYTSEVSNHVLDIVDLIGATNLRYPGGSVTEELFDMTDIENSIQEGHTESGDEQLVPFSNFIEAAAQLNTDVTLVIPTRGGFTQTAFEALEQGTLHGD